MYNSTIFTIHPDGTTRSACVGEVDGDGRILRSNAVQFTGAEGTPAYEDRFRRMLPEGVTFTVESGTAGYRDFLGGARR